MFLRNDCEGNAIYFPFGNLSTGYKLNSEQLSEVKKRIETNTILMISSGVVMVKLGNLKSLIILLPMLVSFYVLYIYVTCRKFSKSNVGWKETSRIIAQKKAVTLKGLLFSSLGMLVFISASIWFITKKSDPSPVLGWSSLLFFSVGLGIGLKKILKKEYVSS